ncbi:MAG: mechanosensitive ion channel [Legionellales bacterium]|nr:mechanosensitive ion channel [Legionellales bacterium]
MKKNKFYQFVYLFFWVVGVFFTQISFAESCDTSLEISYQELVRERHLYQGDYWKLVGVVQSSLFLQDRVSNCARSQITIIKNLSYLLEQFKVLQVSTPASVALNKKKTLIDEQYAKTILLDYQIKNLLEKTLVSIRAANFLNIFQKNTPIWDSIQAVSLSDFAIDISLLYQYSKVWMLTDVHWLTILKGGLFIGLVILGLKRVNNFNFPKEVKKIFSSFILLVVFIYYYVLLIESSLYSFVVLSLVEMRYFLYLIVIVKLFLWLMNYVSKSANMHLIMQGLRRILTISALAFGADFVIFLLSAQWHLQPLQNILVNIEITLYNLALLWVNWLVFKTPIFENAFFIARRKIAKLILCLFYFGLIALCWTGYQHVAVLLVPNLITTIVTVAIIMDVNQVLKDFFKSLSTSTDAWSTKFREYFQIKEDEQLWELTLLRLILLCLVISVGLSALQQIWGGLLFATDRFFHYLAEGIMLFNIVVYPMRIVQAFIVFCFLMLLGRYISKIVTTDSKFQSINGQQNLVRNIMQYGVGFVSAMVALVVAGIDARQVTIISGLFTFGLGVGLKDMVADISSGIYILFSKPVQIGDCIMMEDGTEGKICHIGLISTRVKTFSHYDIFITNSRLLSHTIRNYSFQNNKAYRINTTIALEDKNKVAAGKQLLFDAATQHPKIIQKAPNEPSVWYEDDALILWCDVTNTHESDMILSELNLIIAQMFNAKKITFSFK